jgi:hypothetical protein
MVWATFRGMKSHVFKLSYAIAAELRKVPLEIFFNPAILSDDNLQMVSNPSVSWGRGDFSRPKQGG